MKRSEMREQAFFLAFENLFDNGENILGVEIPVIDLYAEDTTILEKIIVKLRDNLLQTE